MCGIGVIAGTEVDRVGLEAMARVQRHRGPDASGVRVSPCGTVGMAHNRLSVIDLSDAGRQPLSDETGRWWIGFNGEIYNYRELRAELDDRYAFRTGTDTEVLLAAYREWGADCLDRLVGMFAFVVWDETRRELFAARDRFGVKPLFVHDADGVLRLASEIKALHAAGAPAEPDPHAWATYLATGMYDHDSRTFWRGIRRLLPGSCLKWSPGSGIREWTWYDPAVSARAAGPDERQDDAVAEELEALLEESVRLRFRSDVPVGVCLSGGLDSSLLLGLVHAVLGADSDVQTFTFYCGDPAYDELPWVEKMLEGTRHPARFCRLTALEVPELAARVQWHQDEPFGGIPTLGMARVHERAREEGVTVLLDGNGLDEGWGGYEYYARAAEIDPAEGPVQGSRSRGPGRSVLLPEFAALAEEAVFERPFGEAMADLQYRDIRYSKIPRAMRFADRVSMMYSRELREPFLDHRILELGLRQPPGRKVRDGMGKWLPRRVAHRLVPRGVREAPKRPVQTPQREWLRGPLAEWARDRIEVALEAHGGDWLDPVAVRAAWEAYASGQGDNSFFVWQWVSMGLIVEARGSVPTVAEPRGE